METPTRMIWQKGNIEFYRTNVWCFQIFVIFILQWLSIVTYAWLMHLRVLELRPFSVPGSAVCDGLWSLACQHHHSARWCYKSNKRLQTAPKSCHLHTQCITEIMFNMSSKPTHSLIDATLLLLCYNNNSTYFLFWWHFYVSQSFMWCYVCVHRCVP